MGLSPKLSSSASTNHASTPFVDTTNSSHFAPSITSSPRNSPIRYPPPPETRPLSRSSSFHGRNNNGGDEESIASFQTEQLSAAGTRRRTGSAAMRAEDYGVLPSFIPPGSPLLGGSNRSDDGRNGGGSNKSRFSRKRIIILLVVVGIVLLLTPSSNRRVAHKVLTSAGVPLPDHLVSDRLHDLLESWEIGTVDDGSDDLAYVANTVEDTESDDRGIDSGDDDDAGEKDSLHIFHPNGHLFVQHPTPTDAPSPHPILLLIRRAEKQWNKKIRSQSRTLKDAAAEYRRRYKRNPPRGFDQWWEYARANRIVLTDEYDQIHRDLEPFWALEPQDLLHRTEVMEVREETFTLSVNQGKVNILGDYADLRRAKDLGDLISRFSTHVGNVNLTFTRHDQPACQLGWYHKEKMMELASMGEYFGPSAYVVEGDHTLSNWANGCPPDSALREVETAALNEPVPPGSGAKFKSHSPAYATELSQVRSYIFDHQAAMDVCQHPEIMPIHGFTTSSGTDAGPLVPLFTFAKTNIHSDILVTPLEQYSDTYIGFEPDFKNKRENRLLWRGSTTGAVFDAHSDWRASQRSRLHFMTHEKYGKKSVLVVEGEGETGEGKVVEKDLQLKKMNKMYMDVSFSGGPVQCDTETCALLRKVIDFQPTMGLDESYQYKYVIDLDGNGWSGRFHRLMSMKALVLKSTIFPEWYSDRIQPWLHYVPVKVDYTDLYDIMTFFRGTEGENDGHEELAAKIGLAGKRWARDHWRKQDMAAYMFRLTLEWSRLLHRQDDQLQDYTD